MKKKFKAHFVSDDRTPYYVIPATPAAYDAQLQTCAKALAKGVALNDNNPEWEENQLRYLFVAQAKRMLAAIGIHRPATKGARSHEQTQG